MDPRAREELYRRMHASAREEEESSNREHQEQEDIIVDPASAGAEEINEVDVDLASWEGGPVTMETSPNTKDQVLKDKASYGKQTSKEDIMDLEKGELSVGSSILLYTKEDNSPSSAVVNLNSVPEDLMPAQMPASRQSTPSLPGAYNSEGGAAHGIIRVATRRNADQSQSRPPPLTVTYTNATELDGNTNHTTTEPTTLIEAYTVQEQSEHFMVQQGIAVDPGDVINEENAKLSIYQHRHFKLVLAGFGCCLVVILIVIVGVVVVGTGTTDEGNAATTITTTTTTTTTSEGSPTAMPTPAPTQFNPLQDTLKELLIDNNVVWHPTQFQNETSPYSRALKWLVYDDGQPTIMDMDPDNSNINDAMMLLPVLSQRFLMAVFYYSTSNSDDGWLACNPPPSSSSSSSKEQEDQSCIHQKYLDGGRRNEPVIYEPIPNSMRWLSDGSECNWAGVGCGNDSWLVESIDLEYYHLAGTIPMEFGMLSGLKNIRLKTNALVGPIPVSINSSKMTSLEKLWLSDNQLTGTLPITVCEFTSSLMELEVSGNELSGMIPSCLGELVELKELALDENNFEGTIPKDLTNLTNLEKLEFDKNELTGTVPVGFCEMNLKQLKADCEPDDEPRVECDCCEC